MINLFTQFICLLLISISPILAETKVNMDDIDMKASLYEMGTHKLQFNWIMDLYPDSNIPYKTYFYTPTSKLSVEETMIINPTTKELTHYEYTRYEINETSSLTVSKNIVLMEQNINGKKQVKKVLTPSNLVAGPMTAPFISDHINEFLRGETLVINYAVLDRLAFYAFTLKIDPTHPEFDDENIVIKMNPQSLIMQQFADPVYFIFNPAGDKLIKIIGRTVAIKKDRNKITPVNADFVVKEQLWPRLRL